jgi:hypothetical protein
VDYKKIIIGAAVLLVVFGAGFMLGRSGNSNDDDPRIQRIYDSVVRIESSFGTLDAGLKRIEQAAVAGEAGTKKVIGGIGTAISLMEDSAERERNSARNRAAAAERVEFLENHFHKIYQREQAKTK